MSFLRAVIADHLASPAAAGFSVSKIKGQARVPTTSVSASVLSRVGAAFAAMTAPGPADVGLGSVCPLIIGPRHNEAGIG